MSLSGILLGLINIAMAVAILLFIGAVAVWLCSWAKLDIPENVKKIYIAIVVLIALAMLIALVLNVPTVRILQHDRPAIGGIMPPTPSIMVPEKEGT